MGHMKRELLLNQIMMHCKKLDLEGAAPVLAILSILHNNPELDLELAAQHYINEIKLPHR